MKPIPDTLQMKPTTDVLNLIKKAVNDNNIDLIEALSLGFDLTDANILENTPVQNLNIWRWYKGKNYKISQDDVLGFIEKSCSANIVENLQWLQSESLLPDFKSDSEKMKLESIFHNSFKCFSYKCIDFWLEKYPKLKYHDFINQTSLSATYTANVKFLRWLDAKGILPVYGHASSVSFFDNDLQNIIFQCIDRISSRNFDVVRDNLETIDFWFDKYESLRSFKYISIVINIMNRHKTFGGYDFYDLKTYKLLLKWCSKNADKLID